MEDVTEQNIIDELQWRGLINQSTDVDALREACETPLLCIAVLTQRAIRCTRATWFR